MDVSIASLADARNNMVDGQLRPNKVTDKRVIDAMRRLKREDFVLTSARALAYADAAAPMGEGRFLLEPIVVARLVQFAEVAAGGRVLVLGAGYAAAVFACCGAQVTVLEQDVALLHRGQAAYAANGLSITCERGPLVEGWAASAPYDCIFIEGGVTRLPPLQAQLAEHPPGRLCAVLVQAGRSGVAVMAERAAHALAPRPLFDCAANLIPAFSDTPAFTF